ncbi:MAG: hypothetical protein ABI207_00155 [Crocinitomicaceae bacterium]
MTIKRTLLIISLFVAHFIGAQQYLYVETSLGGHHEPLPEAYYVKIDSINVDELIHNDSLLVAFLNSAQKIYCFLDLMLLLRDIDSSTQENFQFEYNEKRKNYNFIREAKWDNFYVKIAVVNHSIKYSELKFANPRNAEEYEYYRDAIHIKIIKKSIFNIAYCFK